MQPPCPEGRLNSPDCPPAYAISDPAIDEHYEYRSWHDTDTLGQRSIQFGIDAEAPTQPALMKILGPSNDDALRSLAAKIWMIEQAQHTIDATYYIFTDDLVGRSILGAMCNAVKRGVDIRVMVDSIGSFAPVHSELKGLKNCGADAGFMINGEGQVTDKKARVQVAVFNALSKVFVRVNRRSHDKLLVIDGKYPEKAMVMTGGRNISLDYYGITDTGELDPNAFKDLEIILKPGDPNVTQEENVAYLSELYFSILFLHDGNKILNPWFAYRSEAEKAQHALSTMKSFENFSRFYAQMPEFMSSDFKRGDVRLAHELSNLQAFDVVDKREEILDSNPNSIVALLRKLSAEDKSIKKVRIVTPYIFLPEYTTPTGKVRYDGREQLDAWLAEDPERTVEIISNSVMTSDNFLAQAMIDMDMAPRSLLSPELIEWWRKDLEESELDPALVQSADWQEQINNPRIKIYQLGRNDSVLFGGDTDYGKLHAKFLLMEDKAFVGTTNLDYRSRLFNNEMGFFIQSEETKNTLETIFQQLKSESYLWGSPEWLEMRQNLRDLENLKGLNTERQRKTYTNLVITGLKWQI